MNAIAALFGVPAEQIARLNRIAIDDELLAGETLRIPNPFEAERKNLEAQVQQLSARAQEAEGKLQSAEAQGRTLSERNSELTVNNAELAESVKSLPWWRDSAYAALVGMLLMAGVTTVMLFEWWMLRRRFAAVSGLAQALGRLDVKYKQMLSKAELRMQQLYGRRRLGTAENPQHPQITPEEAEIERLNHELKETLATHLERLGVRSQGKRRARWGDMVSQDESTAEPRTIRR